MKLHCQSNPTLVAVGVMMLKQKTKLGLNKLLLDFSIFKAMLPDHCLAGSKGKEANNERQHRALQRGF